ncbi:MAG: hypothetical protein ACFFAU_01410 [Candidatus Hodarchaeota archaeon]
MGKFPYNAYKSDVITATDTFQTITPDFDAEEFYIENLSDDYDIIVKFDNGDEITIKAGYFLGGVQDFDKMYIKCASAGKTASVNYTVQGYIKLAH